MPGIVGLITKMPRERAESELRQMVATLRHESFYDTGTWIDDSQGVYVGWAVRKGSFAEAMPICNERGDAVLIFSGEEFSGHGAVGQLRENGHVLPDGGPSYLIHLYEEDPRFLSGLNGQFHGLLLDRKQAITMLFNDRYGMHRINYHESPDAFYFGAEAKAILAVRPELRKADWQSLGEFVACGSVLENRTLFKQIHLLPSASAWIFRNREIERKDLYFQPKEWEEQGRLSPDDYYRSLRNCLSQDLPRYFNGRERVGVSLTGGLDTRLILAWRKSNLAPLASYTYGGMLRDCQDVIVARRVADSCKLPHQTITLGNDFLARFPEYAERTVYLTDGCGGVSSAADLYFSEKVREIAPVRIVGTYSSELLSQVPTFKPLDLMPGLYNGDFTPYLEQAGSTYAAIRQVHPVTFAAFRQSPWWHYGTVSLEQTQVTVRSPFLDNDFVRTVYRAPKFASQNGDVRLRLIQEGNPALGRIRSDRGIGGSAGRLATMAAHGFQEFTFKAEYAYDYGMPQWLARMDHFFSPFHFERLFLGRHKFQHYRVWYRDALSSYVRQILLDSTTLSRPYLERLKVQAIVHDHLKGLRNYTTEIHKALTVELLQRQFFDPR